MDHLSGLDATFLYLETPEQPMHVGGLNVFELPAGYEGDFVDDLRTHITQRMHLAPVFRRKLVNMPFENTTSAAPCYPSQAPAPSWTNWWGVCIPAC
jgi:Wax ester synthase-like Acyl-CoA acyltransferase domain